MSTKGFYVIEKYVYRNQEIKSWTNLKGRPLLVATECNSKADAKEVLCQRYGYILKQVEEEGIVGLHTLGYERACIKTARGELEKVILEIRLLL